MSTNNPQLSPAAVQSNVTRVRTKSTFIIVLEIIIIILILIHFGLYVINNNNLNTVQNQLCIPQQSELCNDFNPCTIDYIESACGNLSTTPGASCQSSFQCINIPLANGSCCNRDDYCYLDDPNKACVFGECKSPDPTLCKGYCNTTDDCTAIPLNVDPGNIDLACEFNSCVTTVLNAAALIPDPLSLLNSTDDFTNRNLGSCLQATCAGFSVTSFCYYTFTCAPFINVNFTHKSKKRFQQEELQIGNLLINNTIFFDLPGYFNDEYYIINNRLNDIARKLLDRMLNSTSQPPPPTTLQPTTLQFY